MGIMDLRLSIMESKYHIMYHDIHATQHEKLLHVPRSNPSCYVCPAWARQCRRHGLQPYEPLRGPLVHVQRRDGTAVGGLGTNAADITCYGAIGRPGWPSREGCTHTREPHEASHEAVLLSCKSGTGISESYHAIMDPVRIISWVSRCCVLRDSYHRIMILCHPCHSEPMPSQDWPKRFRQRLLPLPTARLAAK